MKLKNLLLVLILFIIPLAIYGCGAKDNNINEELREKDRIIEDLTEEKEALQQEVEDLQKQLDEVGPTDNVLTTALNAADLLKAKDMNSLSAYIHPEKGVRFSPYFYINLQEDKVFTSEEIADALQNTESYNWGEHDGTGDPIEMTFEEYYDRFVYDQDFANPHLIGNDTRIGQGNTLDNLEEAYPNGKFIEFHFTGFDPQYEGIDWRSLKLVFEELNGNWYIVGIVHGEWTI